MSLPTPPKYVVIPHERIEQAYALDKPRRALLATFVRLLSLAWESKYQKTTLLNEEELMTFLKLSRRQYYEQKADMELLGWLRSSHPRPGFVQFTFSHIATEILNVGEQPGAEKRIDGAEKRTESGMMEEEDSLIKSNTNPPPPSSEEEPVRKSALREIALAKGPRKTVILDDAHTAKMRTLIEHLTLVFEPEEFGVLDWREAFEVGLPERVLGWIAKAYHDRRTLTAPIGLIVTHILDQAAPNSYYLKKFREILPADYLEAIGEFEIECDYCTERFPTRAAKDEHRKTIHANHCDECCKDFGTADELKTHYEAEHDPYRLRAGIPAFQADLIHGDEEEKAWQKALEILSMEMPRASFDTWVRDTEAVRYDGNVLSVGCRNAYARDWLANRMSQRINQLLPTLFGKPVTVRFTVPSEVDA